MIFSGWTKRRPSCCSTWTGCSRAPALVLGAYRSDEVPRGHPLRSLRSELRRRRRLRELTVEPLGPVDAADLAARVLHARLGNRLAAAVYDRTQGVPFFVEEFASTLAAAGRVEQAGGTVELGPARPPAPRNGQRGRFAARAAPVVSWPTLARDCRCGRASGSTWSWWSRLAAQTGSMKQSRRVSGGGGPPGAFRHDLIREAIYDETAWTRRRAYHRQLAEELERRGAPPEAVAEHWLAGGEHDRARPSLLAAAERFCQVHTMTPHTRSAVQLSNGGRARMRTTASPR